MFADLTGKTALVTGVGDGLGKAIALILVQQGALVALTDLKKELIAGTSKEFPDSKSLQLELDVTNVQSVERAISHILSRWSQIDILVNNAGLLTKEGASDWNASLGVMLMGVVNCCEAVIPHMKNRKYGKIITIASIAGHVNRLNLGREAAGPYPVSKAAALRYTKSLARPLAAYNINVNAVCPGPTWVPRVERVSRLMKETDPSLAQKEPYDIYIQDYGDDFFFDRGIRAEDIGNAVAFLASDSARNISGQCLHVDQGRILHD